MRLYVDWNNDGDFLDAGEDITPDVQGVNWERGRDVASQLTGRSIAGKLTATLKDPNGKYASFNTASPLSGNILPGRRVQLRDDSALPQWTGYLDIIEPVPRVEQLQMARLTAFGPLSYIEGDVETSMLTNLRTDEAIAAQLTAGGWPTELQELEQGQTTLERWWNYAQSILDALREIERTEAGFLLETKEGKIRFEDRHYRLKSPATESQATFSDAPGGLGYSKIEQADSRSFIFNGFEAGVPYYTLGSLAVLWTCPETGVNSPLIERSNGTRTFRAVYGNGVNAWTTPVATTDFLANSQSDGLGVNLTSYINVYVEKYAVTMLIRLTNTHPTLDAYITFLQARGVPITGVALANVSSEDEASEDTYGSRSFPKVPVFFPATGEAYDWTLYQLGIYKRPLPFLEMTFLAHRDAAHLAQALNRDIGDRITVVAENDALLGIDGDFFIEAIKHSVNLDGEHLCTFLLSDALSFSDFWVLDVSGIDYQTRLNY